MAEEARLTLESNGHSRGFSLATARQLHALLIQADEDELAARLFEVTDGGGLVISESDRAAILKASEGGGVESVRRWCESFDVADAASQDSD